MVSVSLGSEYSSHFLERKVSSTLNGHYANVQRNSRIDPVNLNDEFLNDFRIHKLINDYWNSLIIVELGMK